MARDAVAFDAFGCRVPKPDMQTPDKLTPNIRLIIIVPEAASKCEKSSQYSWRFAISGGELKSHSGTTVARRAIIASIIPGSCQFKFWSISGETATVNFTLFSRHSATKRLNTAICRSRSGRTEFHARR